MLLMLLILPLLIFCVLVLATDVRLYRNQLMVFGLVSSLLSGVVAVWIVRTNPKWEASTEIAWTGLEADTAGAPLKIGGSKQDKTMGWPDGAFAPQLTITALGSGQYRLQIARQAAFLVAAGRALNGEPIPDGKQVTSGGYRMSWRRYYVLQRRATLYDEKGPLGEFTIPSSGRDHVLPLTALIDTIIIDLRKTQAGAERARMLELWASRHWLFSRQREGIFTLLKHVLGLGSQAPLPDKYIPRLTDDTRQDIAEINANEVVGVMWQARSQQFNITNTDGRIGAEWQAPWVRNSPPPPKSETHPIGMVVGARALPGDYAFTLPLSDRMSNIRRRMFFSEGHFVESDKANPNRGTLSRYAPDFRRKATAALGNRLLSEITLDAEPYLVRLNSLSDMPDTVGVALIFLVAWGAFATACYLYLSLREHENPVILMGTTCTFWTFLLFRLVLALRYAEDVPFVVEGW